jgi:hypothetical protein
MSHLSLSASEDYCGPKPGYPLKCAAWDGIDCLLEVCPASQTCVRYDSTSEEEKKAGIYYDINELEDSE